MVQSARQQRVQSDEQLPVGFLVDTKSHPHVVTSAERKTRGSQWQTPECEPRSSEVHWMGRDITTTITTTKVNAGCSNHRVASFTQQGRRNSWQPLGWPIIPLPRHMFQSVPECSDEGPLFVVCAGSIGNWPALACTIGNPCQMSSCLACPRGGTSSTPRLET